MAHVRDEILAIEKRLWESGDPAFYHEAMDEQAINVMEPMGFLDKNTAVEMAGKAHGFTDVHMQDIRMVELTPDCVAVAYHGEATSSEGKPRRSSVASTYVRRGGRWKLAMTAHQPWPEKR